jgi:hypothetical protein
MHLIFCPFCKDMVRLTPRHRQCKCGKYAGREIDGLVIEVAPTNAIVCCVDEKVLGEAQARLPYLDDTVPIRAHLVPNSSEFVQRRSKIKND